jgi:GAF domain-containing protein/HAMP domain-containing protein
MKWIQSIIKFINTSLQLKLMLVMSMVVTLTMLAFGFILINTQHQSATHELENRATRTANLLAQNIALPLWNEDTAAMQSQINAVSDDPDVNAVRVIETGNNEPTVKKEKNTTAVEPVVRRSGIIFQRSEEKIPLGLVEVVYDTESLNRSQTQTSVLIGLISVVLILLQVVVIYWLVGRLVTTPLHEMTALTSRIAVGDYDAPLHLKSQDEMNILADAFNSMTSQLSQTLENLEQRVKDRTTDLEASKSIAEKHAKDLEAVADISRSMAFIQDMDLLLPVVADSISEHLGYYHTGIYLMNDTGDFLVMKAASGEGGKRMLKRQGTLPVESNSLVGFVANRKQTRIAQNVERDATYMADPDLPSTKSEAGFPLMMGSQVIGVLDVQSTVSNAFLEQDVKVLTILAHQIAISVQNARLFGETRRALAEAEKVYQQFVQQGWGQIVKETPVQGYKYSKVGLTPLKAFTAISEFDQIPAGKDIAEAAQENHSTILAIPITLRDQTIGTISIQPTDAEARELDEDELAIIQATVERAALALENARLLEDSQRRATRERAIGEISAKISEKSEIDSVLRSTAEELGKKLRDAEITIEIGSAIGK